jgi:non-heme chloroperoxidase
MTLLFVAAAVVVVLLGLVLVVPRLVLRADERRAGPATGLGDPVPGGRPTTVSTDDGAELHVVEWGDGTPIVLVHGLSLDHRSWHYQYIDLADRFRLVGVDLRGHGRSTLGSEPIGPRRFAADLATVLEQRDLRDAVVVGHSLGGTVVGQLCADHADLVRERVVGLVFVGTFASAIAGEGRFREVVSPTMIRLGARFQTSSEPRGRASTSPLAYAMARAPFGPHPQPEQVRFTLDMGSATAPAVMSAATVANIDYDVRDALRQIDRPSLVVRGAKDTLSTERSAAQLEAALADPEVVVFEGCGHLPMLEDRARFAEVLAGFAARVQSPPR